MLTALADLPHGDRLDGLLDDGARFREAASSAAPVEQSIVAARIAQTWFGVVPNLGKADSA